MLDVSSYFEGKVKSIGFDTDTLPATVGVMSSGEYTFGTSKFERMTVITGALIVKLPGEGLWQEYGAGDSFTVEANEEFQLKVASDTSYLCTYG
ncbi:MAG: pyrimidine/purine nucleoside phosphorylase [Gammaproteobacteria bacterium]|nr:pyrimidine/purine nucleoside phosphorylase [Gammaproteobacteria bacterium]